MGSPTVLTILVSISGATFALPHLVIGTIPGESLPMLNRGTALGLVMGVAEVSGGFAAPVIAGWAADRTSLSAPLFIAMGCAIAASVLAVLLKETAPAKIRRGDLRDADQPTTTPA